MSEWIWTLLVCAAAVAAYIRVDRRPRRGTPFWRAWWWCGYRLGLFRLTWWWRRRRA